MPQGYTIALARVEDLDRLPAIELAAAQLLQGHAPESVLQEVTDARTFEAARRHGRLWVARAGHIPVGFAPVEMLAADLPHLDEVDVAPAHGRRGLGTALAGRSASGRHPQVSPRSPSRRSGRCPGTCPSMRASASARCHPTGFGRNLRRWSRTRPPVASSQRRGSQWPTDATRLRSDRSESRFCRDLTPLIVGFTELAQAGGAIGAHPSRPAVEARRHAGHVLPSPVGRFQDRPGFG